MRERGINFLTCIADPRNCRAPRLSDSKNGPREGHVNRRSRQAICIDTRTRITSPVKYSRCHVTLGYNHLDYYGHNEAIVKKRVTLLPNHRSISTYLEQVQQSGLENPVLGMTDLER